MTSKKVTVDLSFKSYVLAVLVLLSILFFQNILGILILVFVSFLITVAVVPFVDFLEKKRIPRGLSTFIILLLIFSSIITLAVSMISPLINQTISFLQQLPPLIERLAPYNIDLSSALTPQLTSAPGNVIRLAAGTFSSLLALFTVIVISYYLVAERSHLKTRLESWFDAARAKRYLHSVEELEKRLGSWVRGQIFLMFLVGFLSYVGFVMIGLPSAVPLAVIAGVLELLPNVGPTVAAIPAVIVGFSISPTHGFLALGLTVLIQQLENNLFVPKIMQHATGLHPVATILVLMIGYRLGGPLLAVLALPLVLSLLLVISHLHTPASKESLGEEIKEEIKKDLSL